MRTTTWFILVLAVCQSASGEQSLKEILHPLLKAINCGEESTPATTDEFVTAFETCTKIQHDMGEACICSCLKKELGWIKDGQPVVDAMAAFIDKQFALDANAKTVWIDGIQQCHAQFVASGNQYPTDYTKCQNENAGIRTLHECSLAARKCPPVGAGKGR